VRVRIAVTESGPVSIRLTVRDLDFLTARLHGRRSRMAEAERLDGLSRIRSLPEFVQTIFPELELTRASDFQREAVNELVRELSGFLVHLSGAGIRFLDWVLVRFQVENVKVLLRVLITKTHAGDLQRYIVPLPRELALKIQGLTESESFEDFLRLAPKGLVRKSLEKAFEIYHDYPQPFFFEVVLDQVYFQELMERVEQLPREDRETVKPVVCQEVDIFHLMLAVRGRFHYGLTPEMLLPLHVQGTRISRPLFAEMLSDPDVYTSAGRAVGRAIDAVPTESGSGDGPADAADYGAAVERLAWTRFLRLANLAFRRSHIRLGAVTGYAGLRRVEVANLITISEGIEKGIDAETIRAHLIPGGHGEAAHV